MNPEYQKKIETQKISVEFIEQVKNKVRQIFGDFNQQVFETSQEMGGVHEFLTKYGDILLAFQELQDKVVSRFEYASDNPNLREENFEQGIDDLKKILNKLTFVMNKWDKKPGGFVVNNNEKNNKLHSSKLTIDKENLALVFNFEEDEQREARAKMVFTDTEGKEYCLRFDLDKKINKVVCDIETDALDNIFKNIEVKDGGYGHHFVMTGLTEYVFEHNDNQEKVIRFREVVEKFKEFLVADEVWERGMLEALMRKFKS